MTDRELMQQALDALEWCYDVTEWPANGDSAQDKAIEALRARLAQPEQKHSEQWWRHEVSNAHANGYEKGRASVKQPEPEPVGWFMEGTFEDGTPSFTQVCESDPEFYVPLYTAPPQREWQGLTDEEITETLKRFGLGERAALARAIEAKLKEKNG